MQDDGGALTIRPIHRVSATTRIRIYVSTTKVKIRHYDAANAGVFETPNAMRRVMHRMTIGRRMPLLY